MDIKEIHAKIVKALDGFTTEMEGYSYFGSNPGIPVDDYDEVADAVIDALGLRPPPP